MFNEHEDALTIAVGPRDHAQGPADAQVTLVEYGDYQCRHCGRAHPIVKQIQRRLGAKLRFVFRNFPLSTIHPQAQSAAEAAEAAGAQGRFWEMHDTLLEHQVRLTGAALQEYAEMVDLDSERFQRDLAERSFEGRVREDFHSGLRSGVNGTPTFFINGVRYDGSWDLDLLFEALGGRIDIDSVTPVTVL